MIEYCVSELSQEAKVLCSLQLVAATIQSSMDDFVVKLLVQMYEPHTADTHIAKYCR